jgi:hypothetical protein
MSWKDEYASVVRDVELPELASTVTVVDDLVKAKKRIVTLWRLYLESGEQAQDNPVFVNLNLKRTSADRREYFCGVGTLASIVAEEPDRLIFLYSPLPSLRKAILMTLWIVQHHPHGMRGSYDGPDQLLGILERNRRVQYLCIAQGDQALVSQIRLKQERAERFLSGHQPEAGWVTAGEVLRQTYKFGDKLTMMLHDLEKHDPAIRKVTLQGARKLFPDLPDDENEAAGFLKSQSLHHQRDSLPAALQGKVVGGLFVDAAGTLFSDDLSETNESVLQTVLAESTERWVYVWTGGDMNELGNALDRHNELADVVMLPKRAFRGLTVEETIDDLAQDELEANYGIKTLKHKQV